MQLMNIVQNKVTHCRKKKLNNSIVSILRYRAIIKQSWGRNTYWTTSKVVKGLLSSPPLNQTPSHERLYIQTRTVIPNNVSQNGNNNNLVQNKGFCYRRTLPKEPSWNHQCQ